MLLSHLFSSHIVEDCCKALSDSWSNKVRTPMPVTTTLYCLVLYFFLSTVLSRCKETTMDISSVHKSSHFGDEQLI